MATMMGEEQVIPVIGPISRSLEGVKIFMKTLLDQKPWITDPSLVPIPWRTTSLLRTDSFGKRKLRIGVLSDDGVVKPHPPILRGINTLVDKLRGNPDIDIVDFPPHKHDEAWRIIASLYFGDGASEEKEALEQSREPWRPLSEFSKFRCPIHI
jgi:Asp-tRNA(Asn)/Glu-tRNA(Gln) amidotransferase A subunit family amidase